jgi:Mg2+ and Co2+ transporter CorA
MSSTQAHEPSAPSVARLTDATGYLSPASPQDVARHMNESSFVWLDVENPSDDELRQFGASLELDADPIIDALRHPSRRSTFTPIGDSIHIALGAAEITATTQPIAALFISIVFTGRLLLTLHNGPFQTLQEVRDRYAALHESTKTDGSLVLFLVLDTLIGSFEPRLLALDKRMDEIQIALLDSSRSKQGGSPPEIRDEIIKIRRTLTEFVQDLTWYYHDLEDLSGTVEQLPGMGPGAGAHFDRHEQRVVRIREAASEYRDEAKDTLSEFSSSAADREGQLINVLTVVATIFLPLTVITSFFGMNFGAISNNLQTNWTFVVLGLLLPAASVVVSYLLYRRLARRFRVGTIPQIEE